ncbi:hypothetical protein MWU59_13870 [Flavobacteriaceae bacterium F08102]|nr:hypothetical protein [Flavobacteriaceae bacterium F08102]
MEKILKNLTYLPKVTTALGYLCILITSLVLFFGRNFDSLTIPVLLHIFPDFYNHVSNLTLSLILYTTFGYIGLMMDITLKFLLITGVIIACINLLVEFFIPFLNTPDTVDAIYGLSGVVIGFIVLFFAKKYGMSANIT